MLKSTKIVDFKEMLMKLKKNTKLSEIIKDNPAIVDYLTERDSRFKLLKNPLIVQVMAPHVSLSRMAKRVGIPFEELVSIIEEGMEHIDPEKTKKFEDSMKELTDIKEKIKYLMKRLFEEGEDVDTIKEEFKELVSKANPLLIAAAEAELTQEGYTMSDLMKACDVHMELFKEGLSSSRRKVSKGHPLWRLIKDHDAMLFWFERGLEISKELAKRKDYDEAKELIEELKKIMQKLKASENHDVRQENTLFPVLEKYGVEEPPAIMWEEHSMMKERRNRIEKRLSDIPNIPYEDFVRETNADFIYLVETFIKHTQKEQEILYNVALDLLSDRDWEEIEKESDELGYFELPKEVLEDE